MKTRKEEKDSSGPRLNQEIKADFVRLVGDEGDFITLLCTFSVFFFICFMKKEGRTFFKKH